MMLKYAVLFTSACAPVEYSCTRKAGNWQESNAGHLACAAHALPLSSNNSFLLQRDAGVLIVCLYFGDTNRHAHAIGILDSIHVLIETMSMQSVGQG